MPAPQPRPPSPPAPPPSLPPTSRRRLLSELLPMPALRSNAISKEDLVLPPRPSSIVSSQAPCCFRRHSELRLHFFPLARAPSLLQTKKERRAAPAQPHPQVSTSPACDTGSGSGSPHRPLLARSSQEARVRSSKRWPNPPLLLLSSSARVAWRVYPRSWRQLQQRSRSCSVSKATRLSNISSSTLPLRPYPAASLVSRTRLAASPHTGASSTSDQPWAQRGTSSHEVIAVCAF